MTKLYQDPFGPAFRLNWLRMIFTWEASIFQFFWLEWAAAMVVCAVVIGACYAARKDTNKEFLDPDFLVLIDTVKFVNTRFQAAVSMMLGFYTSTIYTRWWNVRMSEGACMGNIADLAMAVGTLIRETASRPRDNDEKERMLSKILNDDREEDEDDGSCTSSCCPGGVEHAPDNSVPDLKNVRMQLIRWLNLSHAMVVGDIYEKVPNDFSSLEAMVEVGLCTQSEYEFLNEKKVARHIAPLIWFQDLLMEIREKKLYKVEEVRFFVEKIADLRGSLGGLGTPKNIPIPLSYRQLVNVTVRCYMAISLTASALEDVKRGENLGGFTRGAFWAILAFAFEYFLFVGWLTTADALGNPYRHWADEFSWESYVHSNILASTATATEFSHPSASLSTVNDSCKQMRKKMQESVKQKEFAFKEKVTGHYD